MSASAITPTAVTSTTASPPPTKRRQSMLSDGQSRLAGILLSPTMLVLLVVIGVPIVLSIIESLFLANQGVDPKTGLVQQGSKFVGLGNYSSALGAGAEQVHGVWGTLGRLTNAFLNTMFFTIVAVAMETILGVIMALIMNQAFRGKGVVRAAILVPWAIPTIVSAKMWSLIFNSDGVANVLLGRQVLWLADSSASQWAVVISDVWKTAPFIGLLTLAGLQTIDTQVYEAAKVDGASAWQTFWRITLPLVKPALVVAVLFRTLDTMRMFDLPFGMIGQNKYSVETLSMFAYAEARATRYGPAAAYSILLFLLVALVAFAFIRGLGADLVSDPEVEALAAQRKRLRKLHRQAAKQARAAARQNRALTPMTSGEAQQ